MIAPNDAIGLCCVALQHLPLRHQQLVYNVLRTVYEHNARPVPHTDPASFYALNYPIVETLHQKLVQLGWVDP